MNKYEQLIEAIIAEDQTKAKAIFHQIVVEKSREIYENLLEDDEEDMEDLDDEVEADEVSESIGRVITSEEAKRLMDYVDGGLLESSDNELLERVAQFYGVGVNEGLLSKLQENSDQLLDIAYGMEEAQDDDMMDADMDSDLDMGGDDMPADDGMDMGGDDMPADDGMGDDGAIEDRVMDLESSLDELRAEFDRLMADEAGEEEHDDLNIGDADGDGDMDTDADADGEADADSDDEGEEEPKMESKARSTNSVDIMREYVEKVMGGHGAEKKGAPEGHEVGKAGSSVSVNKQSTVAGKNDMGGTAANLVKGGTEQAPDGTAPKGKAGGFLKNPQEMQTGNVNKVGGNAGAQKFYDTKANAKKGEEGGTNKTSLEPGKK